MPGYAEFKLSWAMFRKGPEALEAGEKARIAQVAARQGEIEGRILASRDAAGVVVPLATLDTRLTELRRRFDSEDDYRQELARAGLSEAELSDSVHRDLLVEAVLDKVTAATPPVSEVDAEIFYRLHPTAFARPEMRRLSHILITFNDASEKAEAKALLEGLRVRLHTEDEFAGAALSHSQCPTALQRGEMGAVKPGQLFPELESAAFALAPGEVSAVLESPVGLHLLRCGEVMPGQKLAFAEVRSRILETLMEKRRSQARKQWIRSLPATDVPSL